MFHLSTHTAALSCAVLLLNIFFSSGKKTNPSDIPSEAEWGSIESIEVDGEPRLDYIQVMIFLIDPCVSTCGAVGQSVSLSVVEFWTYNRISLLESSGARGVSIVC